MSLWDKYIQSSPKSINTYLGVLMVIWGMISVLEISISNVLAGVMSGVSGYDSIRVMISFKIFNGHSILHVFHWFALVFLMLLFCVWNLGDNFSTRWIILLICLILRRFL